jgi:hypothetical protein
MTRRVDIPWCIVCCTRSPRRPRIARNNHLMMRGSPSNFPIPICILRQSPCFLSSGSKRLGSWPKIRPLRIRVLTMDVTGTLVSFRGSLSQHYVKSAEKCGVRLPSGMKFDAAFKAAYKEVSRSTFLSELQEHSVFFESYAHFCFRSYFLFQSSLSMFWT